MRPYSSLILLLPVIACQSQPVEHHATAPVPPTPAALTIEQSEPVAEAPFVLSAMLRDPFQPPLGIVIPPPQVIGPEFSSCPSGTAFTRDDLESLAIEAIALTNGDSHALIANTDGDAFVFKEGDRLGDECAVVEQIADDHIVLRVELAPDRALRIEKRLRPAERELEVLLAS